jgi:hypothetical protein
MCHHHVVLVYLTCSFYFLLLLGSSKGLAEQLAIDSYLAVELMVLLIAGKRLKTSPCTGLVKVGMLSKQAPIEVAIGAVSA